MTNYTGAGISFPDGIVTGPDGALWFTNDNPGGSIGRITTAGTVTNYSRGHHGVPQTIVVGPDGALWFTTINDLVWRITTAGNLTSYPGGYNSYGIAVGPDGALWTANGSGSSGWIGRITTTGTMTSYPVLPDGSTPTASRPGPTGRCGSRTGMAVRSGGSPPPSPPNLRQVANLGRPRNSGNHQRKQPLRRHRRHLQGHPGQHRLRHRQATRDQRPGRSRPPVVLR